MSISLKLDTDAINKTANFLNKVHREAIPKAMRVSIKKTIPTYKKAAVDEVFKRYKLRKGAIGRLMKTKTITRGKDIDTYFGVVDIKKKTINLIEFVKGSKKPRAQGGIPVGKRKGIKIEIKRGNVIRGRDRFIVRTKGRNSVFRRFADAKSTGRGKQRTGRPMKRQSVPSPTKIFKELKVRTPMSNEIGKKFQKQFEHQLNFFINIWKPKSK